MSSNSEDNSKSGGVGKLIAYVVVYVARVLFTSLLLFLASKVDVTKGLMGIIHLGGFSYWSYLFLSFFVHTIIICFKQIEDGDDGENRDNGDNEDSSNSRAN